MNGKRWTLSGGDFRQSNSIRNIGCTFIQICVITLVSVTLSACLESNTQPKFIQGHIDYQYYDGQSDDLLTAGLGIAGLLNSVPPQPHSKPNPSRAELRRLTIYNNYRALVDPTNAGGFGRLYGPNVFRGELQTHNGKIAGKEYVAQARFKGQPYGFTLMVQIPDHYNPKKSCLVVGASSGSRGIYGAIGTAGEWGLNQGCMVAYTDKGSGVGLHDFDQNIAINFLGETVQATENSSLFSVKEDLSEYQTQYPNRVAFKHTYSGMNIERYWGEYVLAAIEFAFYIANLPENFGKPAMTKTIKIIKPENTWVLGASISNGGGAVLSAAEKDIKKWIDGIVVSEPNMTLKQKLVKDFSIEQGEQYWDVIGRPLFDYVTLLSLLQPCASLAGEAESWPSGSEARCIELAEAGLVEGDHVADWVVDAQSKLNAYGFVPEQSFTQHANNTIQVPQSLAINYANAYGRFSVVNDVCQFSMAFTGAEGTPIAANQAQLALSFANANGIAPTAGVQLINNQNNLIDRFSTPDQNFAGHLCLRQLWTGNHEASKRVKKGVQAVQLNAKKLQTPAIILHGRADAIIPVNHSSRPYYMQSHIRSISEDAVSIHAHPVTYIEVLNTQHLDALNAIIPAYKTRYVGLHYYFSQAMDLMYDHLSKGSRLPDTQVIQPETRESADAWLQHAHYPALMRTVPDHCQFKLKGQHLTVPETCS